jgi:CheY-like chemotaxis protein
MDQVSTYHPATTTTAVATAPGPKRGAILVVEDRYDVRSGVVQLLELYGYEVVEAANGEEAVRCLTAAAETFALILLDLLLPGGVSGHDVRAQQLADARAADIPTVVVRPSIGLGWRF